MSRWKCKTCNRIHNNNYTGQYKECCFEEDAACDEFPKLGCSETELQYYRQLYEDECKISKMLMQKLTKVREVLNS